MIRVIDLYIIETMSVEQILRDCVAMSGNAVDLFKWAGNYQCTPREVCHLLHERIRIGHMLDRVATSDDVECLVFQVKDIACHWSNILKLAFSNSLEFRVEVDTKNRIKLQSCKRFRVVKKTQQRKS